MYQTSGQAKGKGVKKEKSPRDDKLLEQWSLLRLGDLLVDVDVNVASEIACKIKRNYHANQEDG